jgi:hypothetical protein
VSAKAILSPLSLAGLEAVVGPKIGPDIEGPEAWVCCPELIPKRESTARVGPRVGPAEGAPEDSVDGGAPPKRELTRGDE